MGIKTILRYMQQCDTKISVISTSEKATGTVKTSEALENKLWNFFHPTQ